MPYERKPLVRSFTNADDFYASAAARSNVTTSPLQGLGMSVAEVTSAISSVGRALTNPYLPETICRAKQIYALRTGASSVPQCAKTQPNLPGGIGLKKAIVPVRGFSYAEQHKWVYPASVAALLGIPFLLGYLIGRKH